MDPRWRRRAGFRPGSVPDRIPRVQKWSRGGSASSEGLENPQVTRGGPIPPLTELGDWGEERGREVAKRGGRERAGGSGRWLCADGRDGTRTGWMKQPTQARGRIAARYPFPAHAPRVGLEPRGAQLSHPPGHHTRGRERDRQAARKAELSWGVVAWWWWGIRSDTACRRRSASLLEGGGGGH